MSVGQTQQLKKLTTALERIAAALEKIAGQS